MCLRRQRRRRSSKAYTQEEVLELAEVVYLHVFEQYETAANSVYSSDGRSASA